VFTDNAVNNKPQMSAGLGKISFGAQRARKNHDLGVWGEEKGEVIGGESHMKKQTDGKKTFSALKKGHVKNCWAFWK